jgi:nascent polypeptide-associated complex subunit alpha
MFPGMNPKKMQAAMKQMGISQQEIPAEKVVIHKNDGSKTIIENPSIQKIKMQGQETFQVSGEISEESAELEFSEEDIQTIIDKTDCSKEKAKETLEKNEGDIAQSIMDLSE